MLMYSNNIVVTVAKLHLPVNKNNNFTFCIQDKPLLSHGFLITLCSNCWQTFIFLKNEKHCVCEFGGISFPSSWSLINAVVKTLLDSVEVRATENTSERMYEQTVFFPFTIHRACVGTYLKGPKLAKANSIPSAPVCSLPWNAEVSLSYVCSIPHRGV